MFTKGSNIGLMAKGLTCIKVDISFLDVSKEDTYKVSQSQKNRKIEGFAK